jgi:hypothetical protein
MNDFLFALLVTVFMAVAPFALLMAAEWVLS